MPDNIMFIRHAEKPDSGDGGVKLDGTADTESLEVRGWQRAGALARFFDPLQGGVVPLPTSIYAAGIGHKSHSERPEETITPLAALMSLTPVTKYLKDEGDASKKDGDKLMKDVLKQTGNVLVCWEHTLIPGLCGQIPGAPSVPQKWPGDRFDIVWVMTNTGGSWSFSQVPQMLLSGDIDQPINS